MTFLRLFLLLVLTTPVFGQDRIRKVDSLLNALYAAGKINGCFLIAEKGKVVYNKSFGLANETTREKLNENSVFELASVSKQFTAMGIMMLQEKGQLNIDDEIKKHIPELAMYPGITIRNLLTHTGGLADYEPLMEAMFDKSKIASNKDIIALFASHQPPVMFEPGSQFQYSNTGYALLASIIERVSGLTFADFLAKNIFIPLKMRHTLVYNRRYAPKKVNHYALGYVYSDSLNQYILPDNVDETKMVVYLDGIVGDGCVNSTTGDLLKWDRALYSTKLLTTAGMKQLFMATTLKDNTKSQYGFGWFLLDYADFGKITFHSGGWPGYRTFIERHINTDKTIIVLQNHENVSMPVTLIRDILYGRPLPAEKLKQEIQVPENILRQYEGLYTFDGNIASIVRKEDGGYFFLDGQYSKMHFISETTFFNLEFPAEKHFIRDASGRVTGYTRTAYGTPFPNAVKVVNIDTLKGREELFNTIGWSFLECKMYDEAIQCLKRGLVLYPNALAIEGNLAHGYLFKNDYEAALKIYRLHLAENVMEDLSWKDMIRQDFVFFKNLNFDKSLMDKVFSDLHLEAPEAYKN